MAAVYRGEHRTTGVPVAVKVIRQNPRGDAGRRFHEEVRAHAGLQHPGVVYLFDYGELTPETAETLGYELQPGTPFVAMELADRGTVRDAMLLEDWETVCRLLVQVLDALAYAHARGVVHLDLKPENLLLFGAEALSGSEGRVKLADFGIARALQPHRAPDGGEPEQAVGTPLYMTPEQFRTRLHKYGPWTDLYAVGCIAWELVCGHPPFRGDSFLSIALRHETDDRPPLEPRFPVPEALESWIHRAMAVDPKHRFRRAADAAWALPRSVLTDATDGPNFRETRSPAAETIPGRSETPSDAVDGGRETAVRRLASTVVLQGENEVEWSEAVADGDGAPPSPETTDRGSAYLLAQGRPPLPEDWRAEHTERLPAPLVGAGLGLFGLREPPFVNRTRECRRIWQILREVVEDQTLGAVFVHGEAGTGKSRLVEWTAARAHEMGAVRVVRAVHTDAGGPREGLRGALERDLRTAPLDRSEVFEHLLDELPPLETFGGDWTERDARALTEYLRPTEDGAAEVDGPRYRFSSADQKRGLLVRILRRLAWRRPVLLWLDDLQWGGESMGVVEALVERSDELPAILTVATVRSDIARERPELEENLERLEHAESSTRLTLNPLEVDDQRNLLEGLLPLDGELSRLLAERTEGHPLFAMQLLAHWIDKGMLEADAGGFRVPEQQQVELPEDIHELWMDRIDRLVDHLPTGDREVALEALERAATLGREVDDTEWHELCRSFDGIEPARLRRRLVEAGLAEETDRGWAFAHGLFVDSLQRRADSDGRRAQHHRRCAELLEHLYPDQPQSTAARRADHWVEAGEPEEALEPLLQNANRLREWGEFEEYRRVLERRGELLEQLDVDDTDSRSVDNALRVSRAELVLGAAPDATLERLDELRRRAEQTGDDGLVAAAWRRITYCRQHVGEWRAAAEATREACRLAKASDDDTGLVRALRSRSWAAYNLGNLDEAEEHMEAARAHATEAGLDYQALRSQEGLGWIAMGRSHEERASTLLEEALDGARQAGYRSLEADCLNGLGEMARFRGDDDEARERYRQYGELNREVTDPYGIAMAAVNLAQVELMAGSFTEASRHLNDAERRLDELAHCDSRRHLLRASRLTRAAGEEDWSRFDNCLSHYSDGWPEDARLIKDHPWLLEMAGDYAAEAAECERAREVWQLARELWQELGDGTAASEVAEKLDS